jgi:serine/threonine protein kinase
MLFTLTQSPKVNTPNPKTLKETRNGMVSVAVKGILFDGVDCQVALIQLNDEASVVKKGKSRYAKSILIDFELINYRKISRIQGMEPFLVPLRTELKVEYGLVMEYASGNCLEEWIEKMRFDNTPIRDEALQSIFLHVFHGLKLLH